MMDPVLCRPALWRALRHLLAGVCMMLVATPLWAAISFVGFSLPAFSTPSRTSVTVTKPSGMLTNDVMLATLLQRGGANPLMANVPAGWQLVSATTITSVYSVAVYLKVVTASEPASYTFNFNGNDTTGAGIAVFRGVDTNAPVDAMAAQSYAPSSTLTVPSATTTSANTMLVAVFNSADGRSLSAPTGMSAAYSDQSGGAGGGASFTVGFTNQAAAGASGTRQSTGNISAVHIGTMVALRDAPPPAFSVDHYELSLPSASLACLPTTVTVTACSSSGTPCASPATTLTGQTVQLATTAGSLGSTTLTFNASGVAITTLSHPAAANGSNVGITLSAESAAANNPRQCCPNGVSCSAASSCSTGFSTAGFIIASVLNGAAATLPAQTAGTNSATYSLRAVRSGTSTKACEAAITGATTVNWAVQCNNPTTCSAGNLLTLTGSSAVAISSNPNSGVSSYTAVPMVFDANGNAPFSLSYADVGLVSLFASKAASGTLLTALTGSSNAFVVRPADFMLSNIPQTAAPNLANPAAASAAGAKFVKAGEAFSATVTAVTSGGVAAPNFGRETAPEGVLLTAALVQPAGGTAGTLANASVAGGSFSNGVATASTLSYSEVGIITLTPSVASGNYLGAGAVSGAASGNIGRFIPDRFALTAGTPVGACSAAFSYFGQDGFTTPFTLTAQNTSGATTRNYAGLFAKLGLTAWSGYNFSATGLAAGSVLASGAAVPSGSWINGVAAVLAVHQVSRPTAVAAETSVVVRAAPLDSDGVTLAATAVGAGTPLRWGRLRLSNAFGSARSALQLPVVAEYWSGNAWVLNSADNCTTLPAASVVMSNPRDAAGSASAATSSAGALTLAGGNGLLNLAAPNPLGSSLSLDIALNLGSTSTDQSCLALHPASTGGARPWLRGQNGSCAASYDRDPAARASFGVFSPETRKTVHARELF